MDDATPTMNEDDAAEESVGSTSDVEAEASSEARGPSTGILRRMQSLPEAVFAYVMSDELAALHIKIFDERGITAGDRDTVYYAELQTFVGEMGIDDFPDAVWNRLTWDDDQEPKATALILDILGYVFLPAQAHLGDVAGIITQFGGDVKKFPEKQIEVRRVTFEKGAKEIADAVVDVADDMRRRLQFIIESRLRNVRVDADTVEMLMRAKKTGGMELSQKQADDIVALIGAKTRMTKYVEALGDETAAAAAAPAESHEVSAAEIKKIYAGAPEEQQAIAKRIDRFAKVTEDDPAKMRDAYFQVLYPPDGRPTDPLYVVAGLLGMADEDRISDAVEEDERYRAIVRGFLTDRGMQDEVAAYETDPTAPHFMNIFFQFVLRGLGGIDEADSARFGLRIINALKKQGYDRYADLVAFDMEHGDFRWKDMVQP